MMSTPQGLIQSMGIGYGSDLGILVYGKWGGWGVQGVRRRGEGGGERYRAIL